MMVILRKRAGTVQKPRRVPSGTKGGTSSSKNSRRTFISLHLLASSLFVGLVFLLYKVESSILLKNALASNVQDKNGPVVSIRLNALTPRTVLQPKPRMVGIDVNATHGESILFTVQRLDANNFKHQHSTLSVGVPKINLHRQFEKINKGGCVDQFEWQKQSFPTCNTIMEQDWSNLGLYPEKEDSVRFLAHGYWRDVWRKQTSHNQVAMKTLRYEHDITVRNNDRHRRDAVAMERMTSSPFVVDIYGFCGNTGLFEFADGGSVEDAIGEHRVFSPEEKVTIAHQLASGLADLHFLAGKEDVPTIAHTDITSSQFVYMRDSGTYKLNDFNRCRFLPINEETNEICPFEVGNNPGKGRSPEEYKYEPETERVDVYSLGNVFYEILRGKPTFYGDREEVAQKLVMEGVPPLISGKYYRSTDPYDQIMIRAIEMCWIYDAKKRPTSREVQRFLAKELKKLKKEDTMEFILDAIYL